MRNILTFLSIVIFSACGFCDSLDQNFNNPSQSAGVRCWWWWLNGNVTKAAITKDLQAMHDKGFSGAMIFDAGTELKWGPDSPVPAGPLFGSPQWRELYLHAIDEADRLGLKLGLSIQSGWNLGGPYVTPDFAAKQLTWSEIKVEGPGPYNKKLPVPENREGYYRDICVLAYPENKSENQPTRMPIQNLSIKSAFSEVGGSAPDCRFLLNDHTPVVGEEDATLNCIQNITAQLSSDGTLKWDVPSGTWTVLRFGYTITDAHVATSSGDWKGHVLDYLSKDAFNCYWDRTVEPLLKAAGPRAGTVLTDLETDSWECGGMNWSPGFAGDFKNYNGYDITKYLPVIAGKIVENRTVSNAFLADFRKTLAHCVSENHYRTFAQNASRFNIGIQPECSGPHAGPIDGIKNYGHSNIMMSEFWVPSPHRPTPERRFFVKQASSAAHIYGKQYVGAESFTSIGPHWNDVLWQSQKPSMDHEFCSGLNMIFFHTFTCSPEEMGLPGQEYFAGTHINPQVTWWEYSDAFIDYINRIQSVVQRSKFVADVLYYYGDHVPNIAALKESDPAGVLPGYDYDVTSENVLLELKVDDGKVVVPGGIRYRVLVLPDHKVLSLAAMQKVQELLQQGATVLGPKAERLVSLVGGESAQQRFHKLSDELWTAKPGEKGERTIGKGRLLWGQSARQLLDADGIAPDFEAMHAAKDAVYDYIHYTVDDADVYFVCNQTQQAMSVDCAFRVSGKQPELWNPVTGSIRQAKAFKKHDSRTTVPLQFDPYGSCFVVFRKQISANKQGAENTNYPVLKTIQTVEGPWQVSFDPAWGGPKSVQFNELTNWTQNSDEGIRYYSGKAVYRNTFDGPNAVSKKRYWLVLNDVEDIGIAGVRLNGKDMGTVWTKPFRVEVTDAIQRGTNNLEIAVVNSWRNRLVGDRGKPQEERYTKTNITSRKDWELLKSGLLGPVELKSN